MKLETRLRELERALEIQRQYLAEASEERARLATLFSAINIGVLFVGLDNKIVYCNPAFQHIWLTRSKTPLIGMDATQVLRASADVVVEPGHFSKHILEAPQSDEISGRTELKLADARVITQVCYPVRDAQERLVGNLWIYEDVTGERKTSEQLVYLAERDGLTGLYNRRRFHDELARMVREAERHRSRVALLFFDLDDFKYVNDNFGHSAGDALLIRVAGEVAAQVRSNEILSRLGGDEFALLVPDASDSDTRVLAARVVQAISRIPFQFEGKSLRMTSSLGIALFPDHAASSEELIVRADAAMYQAKEAGKNTWRMYRQDLDSTGRMVSRLDWSLRIHDALERNLLRPHFQGIYRVSDRTLCHLETLVYMVDEGNPETLITGGHFIPIAERTGKIRDIDRWVLKASIALLEGNGSIPPIAVNISGRSFEDPTLPQFIAEELQRRNVAPGRLIVELTETAAVANLQDAQRFIQALRETGCKVCLDDFGMGFSSFSYLKHLQADILKIDGQFIRDLPNDRDNQLFVKAIVGVARGMRKETIAEFVETPETLEILKRFGVDMAQGYHLDKPRADHPALQKASALRVKAAG